MIISIQIDQIRQNLTYFYEKTCSAQGVNLIRWFSCVWNA